MTLSLDEGSLCVLGRALALASLGSMVPAPDDTEKEGTGKSAPRRSWSETLALGKDHNKVNDSNQAPRPKEHLLRRVKPRCPIKTAPCSAVPGRGAAGGY